MRRSARGVCRGVLTAVGVLAAGLATPAAAEDPVYTWRTEDGGYAFTDDEKSIPPRYREQARKRESAGIAGYERFTPSDPAAQASYQERLSERLAYLRSLNAELPRRASDPAPATPADRERVTLRTGSRDRGGVDVSVPGDGGDEPITVETMLVRPRGKIVSQNVQVTRRGDRIIAITKPRPREWNVSDVPDEEDLLRRMEPEE